MPKQSTAIDRACPVCNKIFKVWPRQIKRGFGKFCSHACQGKNAQSKIARVCLICQKEFLVIPAKIKLGQVKFCSNLCRSIGHRVSLEDAFWGKVGEPTSTGCRLWLGSKCSNGYGELDRRTYGKGRLLAHRVAWEIANGPIPDDRQVCHTCDTPSCVAISHLWLGTDLENRLDCVNKGRHSHGECHGQAKLTEEKVRLILRRYATKKISQTELAAEFGVRQESISRIVTGKSWKHISRLQQA